MIRFSNVYKAYPNGALALKDVTFHVSKGEFVFLTGHSGAGKSTIMKLLFAEQQPSGGEVRVSGYNVTTLRPDDVPRLRRRLGVVFQDFRLLEDRTAAENIAFALEVTGARTDTIAARVMRVLTQVGLSAKSRAYPRELSGGEQQRVAIARALVNDPAILLADEPTGNLDERATRGVFQLLRDINTGGTVVVMATHDLDLVRQTAYRTIEMRDGAWCTTATWTSAASGGPVKLLCREALLSFRRAPLLSVLSVTTIAFSLFTVGLLRSGCRQPPPGAPGTRGAGGDRRLHVAGHAGRDHHHRHPGYRGLSRGAGRRATSARRRRCRGPASELVEFRDAYRDLQVNPLPASIEVRLKDGYRDAATVERVAQRLEGFGFIETSATAGSGCRSWTSSATSPASWAW